MNIPRLKDVLTDPDDLLTNADLKALALELLCLVQMPGIEGSPLDPVDIYEVVLRAAVAMTSVNAVTTHTSDTPDRKAVMDWFTP